MTNKAEGLPEPEKENEEPVAEVLPPVEETYPIEVSDPEAVRRRQEAEAAKKAEELAEARKEAAEKTETEPNLDSKDFYENLGISPDASAEEIKRAHRKGVLKNHPDSQKDKAPEGMADAEKRFKIMQNAFECLSDPEKRKVYDEGRKTGEDAREAKPGTFLAKAGMFKESYLAVAEKVGGDAALAKLSYEVQTLSGGLEGLTGAPETDAIKLKEFFDEYDMPMDDERIKSMGAGIYEGALKQKKKKDGSFLRLVLKIAKDFDSAVDREIAA